jgi:hypothetical protein
MAEEFATGLPTDHAGWIEAAARLVERLSRTPTTLLKDEGPRRPQRRGPSPLIHHRKGGTNSGLHSGKSSATCPYYRCVTLTLLLADTHTFVCRRWDDLAAAGAGARTGLRDRDGSMGKREVDRPLLPSEQVRLVEEATRLALG